MAWDIHGRYLQPGYCEVHPWIPEEYPCYQCMQNIDREHREREELDAYYEQQRQLNDEYVKDCETELTAQIIPMIGRFLKTI